MYLTAIRTMLSSESRGSGISRCSALSLELLSLKGFGLRTCPFRDVSRCGLWRQPIESFVNLPPYQWREGDREKEKILFRSLCASQSTSALTSCIAIAILPLEVQEDSKMTTVLASTKKFGVYALPGEQQKAVVKPKAADVNKVEAVKVAAKGDSSPAVDLEQLILSTLASGTDIADSWTFAENNKIDHQNLIGALKSLLVDAYAADEALTNNFWLLTDEGSDIASKGSPEFRVYQAVSAEGMSVAELNSSLGDVAKIGLGPCMKNKWLKKDGDRILRIAEGVKDETATSLANLSTASEDDLKNLKRRKLVNQVVRKSYKITKGVEFQPTRVRKAADLTKEMLGLASDVSDIIAHRNRDAYYLDLTIDKWLIHYRLHTINYSVFTLESEVCVQ